MRQYRNNTKEIQEISKIICNKCGKEIPVAGGVPSEDMLEVEKRWGYFSGKDGETHSFDICEKCYDNMVKQFKIPADIKENRELL